MKKQNWLYKLISRLCNRNKKQTFPTVNLPYDTVNLPYEEVKKYIYKIQVKFYSARKDEEIIKSRLSIEIANYIIDHNLINYSVKRRVNSTNNEFEAFLIESNFVILINKITEEKTNVFDKNTDFNSLSRMFSNPDANFNKNPNSNENPQIP